MVTLASASLSAPERRALERLVALLHDEYGDDLHAVWLYGSRARGEPPRDEDSDVDLLVVTTRGDENRGRVLDLAYEAAEAEGLYPLTLSVIVASPDWVAERRAVEAFLIKEVDRDKIPLSGGEVGPPPGFEWRGEDGTVRRRTREYLQGAELHLRMARSGISVDAPAPAIGQAYEAVLNAARAALSEEDRFARTHNGMWHLLHELLVKSGRLSPELHRRTAALHGERIEAVYGPPRPDLPWRHFTLEEAEERVELAERFLRAVEELLGA
jgi:predicted nucleotidyltransferase/HEPN domain-containing protein